MYVQPPERGGQQAPPPDMIVPKNYSGNAFRQYVSDSEVARPEPPPTPDLPSPEQPPEPPPDEVPVAEVEQDGEAAPVWKNDDRDKKFCENGHFDRDRDRSHRHENEQEKRGFFSRFPFLSSLLPPPRGKHKKDGILPEWVVIAAVILLFFSEDGDNDILPFLLLLLLWD
ncbi:MAG: hypothetical protein J6B09_07765 [Clostridia bacterium]|nr:hypothetical protein [Clostridia bacterium]